MNHLENISELKNRYLGLRHGKSEANEAGIIVSDPEIGVPKFGLVGKGRREVRISIAMAMDEGILDDKIVVIASDFLRTYQTGEITKSVSKTKEPLYMNEKLRERFFGDLEGKSNERYKYIWQADAKYPHHGFDKVESANDVQTRTTSLVTDLETHYSGKTFVFASHGDPLQILETGFRKISPKFHRDIPHFQTGELRELKLSTRPDPVTQKVIKY